MNGLKIGKIIEVVEIRLIPVERTVIQSQTAAWGGWWQGSKELYALVIETASGLRALDQHGQELGLDELLKDIPALEEILRGRG